MVAALVISPIAAGDPSPTTANCAVELRSDKNVFWKVTVTPFAASSHLAAPGERSGRGGEVSAKVAVPTPARHAGAGGKQARAALAGAEAAGPVRAKACNPEGPSKRGDELDQEGGPVLAQQTRVRVLFALPPYFLPLLLLRRDCLDEVLAELRVLFVTREKQAGDFLLVR